MDLVPAQALSARLALDILRANKYNNFHNNFGPNCQSKILVLDLDETLIHSSLQKPEYYDEDVPIRFENATFSVYVQKRPGLDEFLNSVSQIFDIYIFTASLESYAYPIIERIWPGFPRDKIFTQKNCTLLNGKLVKELSIFGNDLSNLIIVDDQSLSFSLSPHNGIKIEPFTGQLDDSQLTGTLLPLLVECSYSSDVREPIRRRNRQMMSPRKRRT